jgi:hypothetical protein
VTALLHLARSRWLLLLTALLVGSVAVSAREILQDTNCAVPADVTVEGTLIVFCDALEIDGLVMGDVFGVGLRTVIRGQVNGSVYLAGFTLRHEGVVQRALHYAGISLLIDNPEGAARPSRRSGTL